MKWHFWSKTIFRKLVMFFSSFMGVVLLTKANLVEIKGVHKYPEVDFFVSEHFLGEIMPSYNLFYGGLILVGIGLVLLGWKRYGDRYRDGIWLNNIGTGYLATVFLGYGITNIILLHVISWDGVWAFVISGLLYVLFAKNVFHYTKHKRIFEDDRRIKKVAIVSIVAGTITACAIGAFAVGYSSTWKDKYEGFKREYAKNDYGFIDQEYEYEKYLRLQFVNYFNPEGKTFTYEELEKSIDNYNSGQGSWYTLWYCSEFVGLYGYDSETDINFSSYGYSKGAHYNFANFACDKLRTAGIEPSEATHEQIDEACKYVYDVYVNQEPVEIIGEAEGDIVINMELPDDGDVNDVVLTGDGKRYGAYALSWYEVSSIGQGAAKGAEPATVFENGKVYAVTVNVALVLPYFCYEDAKVEITGTKYEKMEVSSYRDTVSITLWVIPGNDN